MATESPRTTALLSVQRALLGEIFPSLESLWLRIEPEGVELLWCVDGALSPQDRDSISSVEAEMQADFDERFVIRSAVLPTAALQEAVQAGSAEPCLVCV